MAASTDLNRAASCSFWPDGSSGSLKSSANHVTDFSPIWGFMGGKGEDFLVFSVKITRDFDRVIKNK